VIVSRVLAALALSAPVAPLPRAGSRKKAPFFRVSLLLRAENALAIEEQLSLFGQAVDRL
jgi:hypothetical protein